VLNEAPCNEDMGVGVEVWIHIFLTSALGAGEWLISYPGHVTPWKRASSTRWIGGWVSPRANLGLVEKRKIFCLCQELNPDSSTVPPVTCCYPNWATPAHIMKTCIVILVLHVRTCAHGKCEKLSGNGSLHLQKLDTQNSSLACIIVNLQYLLRT
jgi:hypothetical protein